MNCKGYKESTPLHEAAIHEHIDCVKLLLENGADVTIRNSHGFTPKDFAAKNDSILKLIDDHVLKAKILNQSVITATSLDQLKPSQFIESTNNGRRSSTRRPNQKFVIFGTGMSDDEKKRMSELALKLDLKLVKEMSNNCLKKFRAFIFFI